jgi:hypothetical protein
MHKCLERWHRDRDLPAVLDFIDRSCASRTRDDGVQQHWQLAIAMTTGYAETYATENLTIIALEQTFRGPIINPVSGMPSRSFLLGGKVDGIILLDGQYVLLEHKTTSTLDGDYLERLWTDFQITLYSRYLEETLGIRIAGTLYNILVKARLQQGKGETEAEFAARRAELLAKSKSGKTTAQRKLPESDEDFQARLRVKYQEPGMFHREMLYLSRDQFVASRAELWDLTQQFLHARHRQLFTRNTSQCFLRGRTCPYVPLCRANGAPHLIETLYERRPPHEELVDEPSDAETPVF